MRKKVFEISETMAVLLNLIKSSIVMDNILNIFVFQLLFVQFSTVSCSAQWIPSNHPDERVRASYYGNGGGSNYLPPPSSGYHHSPPPHGAGYSGEGVDYHHSYPSSEAHSGFSSSPFSPSPPGYSANVPSNSKSISGDYCFEPLLSCDTTNTLLYCIQGRCTCPGSPWTLAPGNLPLNTVWHPEFKKCVSTIGSGCHVITSASSGNYPFVPPAARYLPSPSSIPSNPERGIPQGHYDTSSSLSPTKEIASTIIKGLIGMPVGSGGSSGSGGMGFVHCQPGVSCVRHPGYQETGICAGTSLQINMISLSMSFVIFSIFTSCIF